MIVAPSRSPISMTSRYDGDDTAAKTSLRSAGSPAGGLAMPILPQILLMVVQLPGAGYGPLLNINSMGATPELPRLCSEKVMVWIAPHVQLFGSPMLLRRSAPAASRAAAATSFSDSVLAEVVTLSNHALCGSATSRISVSWAI